MGLRLLNWQKVKDRAHGDALETSPADSLPNFEERRRLCRPSSPAQEDQSRRDPIYMEKNWMPVLLETLNAPPPTKEPAPEPAQERAPKAETIADPVPGTPVAGVPETQAAPERPAAHVPCSGGFGFTERPDSPSGAIDNPFATSAGPTFGYAGDTPWEESFSERIAARLPGIAVVLLIMAALGLFCFFYRAQVGQTFVRLGEKMSGQAAPQSAIATPGPAVGPSAVQPASPPLQSTPDRQPVASSNPSAANADTAAGSPVDSPETRAAAQNKNSNDTASSSSVTQDSSAQHLAKNLQSAPSNSSLAADDGLAEFRLAHESRNQARTPQEKARAANLFWDAVSKGSSDAEIELADVYGKGEGVLKNCQQARILLAAARDKDNPLVARESSALESYGCR
jgi:hypothetical protein